MDAKVKLKSNIAQNDHTNPEILKVKATVVWSSEISYNPPLPPLYCGVNTNLRHQYLKSWVHKMKTIYMGRSNSQHVGNFINSVTVVNLTFNVAFTLVYGFHP